MRRSFRALLTASVLTLALAGATTALAGENKNSISLDIHCTADGAPVALSGTLFGGAGSALHLEGGGISIAMGLKLVDGTIIVAPNPGLSGQGKLVECSFTFPGQPELIAFAFFAPPGTL